MTLAALEWGGALWGLDSTHLFTLLVGQSDSDRTMRRRRCNLTLTLLLEALQLASGSELPELHVIAMSTPDTCPMLGCWMTNMKRMINHDQSVQYRLHVFNDVVGNRTSSSEVYKSPAWVRAQGRKVRYVSQFMKRAPEDAMVLFTDVDVLPFGPYSVLLKRLPTNREVTFMYTYVRHQPANGGFYLMRNTANVRRLLDMWEQANSVLLQDNYDDQRAINMLLHVNVSRHRGGAGLLRLDWGNFDLSHVSGSLDDVSTSLIAFHAIGAAGNHDKIERLNEAYGKLKHVATMAGGMSPAWRRMCEADTEYASCAMEASPTTSQGGNASDSCPLWLLPMLKSASSLQNAFVSGQKHATRTHLYYTSDKFHSHAFHHMYSHYLKPIIERGCSNPSARRIRMLEIGLGCGMEEVRGKPGGGVRIWNRLFPPPFDLQLHVLEINQPCIEAWREITKTWTRAAGEPEARIHAGDQNSTSDLDSLYAAAGNEPFDIIVDDGSHVGDHQYATLTHILNRGYLKPFGGLYFVEDVQGSCKNWTVMGDQARMVDGTDGCMTTQSGTPTFFAKVVNWMKLYAQGKVPPELPGVRHIDHFQEGVVFQRSTARSRRAEAGRCKPRCS